MKRAFVFTCILSFILLYEDLNHLFVLLIVGDFPFDEALQKAFAYTTISSILFAGTFRFVVFIPLILCAVYFVPIAALVFSSIASFCAYFI